MNPLLAPGEDLMLWDLVQSIGYFPSMAWVNAISGSLEGLLAATTGVKASLASTIQVGIIYAE
jgi:hypothetical protein